MATRRECGKVLFRLLVVRLWEQMAPKKLQYRPEIWHRLSLQQSYTFVASPMPVMSLRYTGQSDGGKLALNLALINKSMKHKKNKAEKAFVWVAGKKKGGITGCNSWVEEGLLLGCAGIIKMCRAKSVTNVLRSRYPQQGGSAQRQIGFGLIFLDGRGAGGQLHAACSARCNLRPLQKIAFIFASGWEVREPETSCAGALCRLTSGDFPRCRVVSSTTTGENRWNTPKIAPVALF